MDPLVLVISEDVPVFDTFLVLLPILNCAVNEVIITDDAAPLTIGGYTHETSPALITNVNSIT